MRTTVRKVFRSEKLGDIAGCLVEEGRLVQGSQVSVYRNGEFIGSETVAELRRFKSNVASIPEGFECGVVIRGFDFAEGDELRA